MVASGAVQALALQQAGLAIEAGLAGLLAPPALVPVRADAGTRYWVTLGSVLALAAVAAVGAPEVAPTACSEGPHNTHDVGHVTQSLLVLFTRSMCVCLHINYISAYCCKIPPGI